MISPVALVGNTIVKTIDNGSGINVEMGYLDTGIPTTPINLAVDEFTIMVVGGYSGVVFPAAKVAVSEAKSTTLIDLGTGIVNKALAIEHANQVMGARVVGYYPISRLLLAPVKNACYL